MSPSRPGGGGTCFVLLVVFLRERKGARNYIITSYVPRLSFLPGHPGMLRARPMDKEDCSTPHVHFLVAHPTLQVPGLHQEFMLTRTSLHELEVDDIISGMPGGAFAANVFAVRRDHNH